MKGNFLVNLLSMAIISFALFIYGLFIYINYNINIGVSRMSEEVTFVIFLRDDPSSDDIEKIKNILKEFHVKDWRFIDKDKARKEFENKFPELSNLLSELGENPFPQAFELRMGAKKREEFYSFEESIKSIPSVSQIYNSGDFTREISSIGRIIVLVGMFFSAILFVASVFTIFNSIRLNLVYYKDIIEIMRLVGASLSFVKFPFYILGFFLGLSGGVISIVFLFLITRALSSYISPFIGMIKGFFPFVFIPLSKILQIIGLSIFVTLFTTWISVKSYMK